MVAAVEARFGAAFLEQLTTRCPSVKYQRDFAPSPSLLASLSPLPPSSRPFLLKNDSSANPYIADSQITLTFKQLKTNAAPIVLSDLTKWDTVASVKARLATLIDIPVSLQRLVISGKALSVDSKFLIDYDIKNGSTVHILRKPGVDNTSTAAAANLPKISSSSTIGRVVTAQSTTEDDFKTEHKKLKTKPAFWEGLEGYLGTQFSKKEHADRVYAEFKKTYNGMS
ncbi:hypothetical protein HK096_007291 [Nowakowskiella sp. JEL0078]|nr:hypothetical protein HK096_007291 [Nowakowskiella sp. JEL0078]